MKFKDLTNYTIESVTMIGSLGKDKLYIIVGQKINEKYNIRCIEQTYVLGRDENNTLYTFQEFVESYNNWGKGQFYEETLDLILKTAMFTDIKEAEKKLLKLKLSKLL